MNRSNSGCGRALSRHTSRCRRRVQGIGIGTVGREHRDPYRCRNDDLFVAQRDRRGDRVQQLGGKRGGILLALDLGCNDEELVTAQAHGGIGAAYRAAQTVRDLLEQRVANPMTQRVVDRLETVQVDEHQHHGHAGAGRAFDLVLQPFAEQMPVAEPGQCIVVSQMAQLGFGFRESALMSEKASTKWAIDPVSSRTALTCSRPRTSTRPSCGR